MRKLVKKTIIKFVAQVKKNWGLHQEKTNISIESCMTKNKKFMLMPEKKDFI